MAYISGKYNADKRHMSFIWLLAPIKKDNREFQ